MPLTFVEQGEPGRQLLVFLHGWPDTGALWSRDMARLSKDYHCLSLTLPNFQGPITKRWGYDFPELTAILADTIRSKLTPENGGKVVLIGHDWGAYLAYLLEQKHSDIVLGLVTIDVGAHFRARSFSHKLFIVSYQWWLVLAFFTGQVLPGLGDSMTRWFSMIAHAPRGRDAAFSMNYLYVYFWRALLFKRFRSSLLTHYQPKKPILYLYGSKKTFHFHSEAWLAIVSANPGSQVIGLPAHHWVNLDSPEETYIAMSRWLATLRT